MANTEEAPAETVNMRPFMDFLREQRNGLLHQELTEQLHALVSAVSDLQQAGELKLSIKVKPAGQGDGSVVIVIDEVTAKIPKEIKSSSIFFITPDKNLSRNSNQGDLLTGPREVIDSSTGEVRTIA